MKDNIKYIEEQQKIIIEVEDFQDIKQTKNILEKTKQFAANYNKIIVMGSVSSGKSFLIRNIGGKEYPQTRNKEEFNKFMNAPFKFTTIHGNDWSYLDRYNINNVTFGTIGYILLHGS